MLKDVKTFTYKVHIKYMQYHYCYIVTNKITGQQYVGDRSCKCLPAKDPYYGSGAELIEDLKKLGRPKFNRKVLQIYKTRKTAFNGQKKFIKLYKTHISQGGYNISWDGGTWYGGQHSKETKQKMRDHIFSEEHKQNLKDAWIRRKAGLPRLPAPPKKKTGAEWSDKRRIKTIASLKEYSKNNPGEVISRIKRKG